MDSARVSSAAVAAFQATVLDYYKAHGRHDLPWRLPEQGGLFDPYKILVSELMLQQTQVPRVLPKFEQFIARFPSFSELAAATLADVLQAWSGLGYNRRAKFLWQAAQIVQQEYDGKLPNTIGTLVALPGIGVNTAGAVLAYAYNKPVIFVETNIRTVFIYHFLSGQQAIDDKLVLDLAARALPADARSWYWALMDYGTHLKQTVGNLNTLSKHYNKQSAFNGSKRQVRGQVLKALGSGPRTMPELQQTIIDGRLADVLADLASEGLIRRQGELFVLG